MDILNLFQVIAIMYGVKVSGFPRTRRIQGGQVVESDQKFMAYLVKAPVSPQYYDAWLCGGTIVTHLLIITSAACIEDIQYMYAIAGYNTYVPAHSLKDDACTKNAKKKVVFTCVPESYNFEYERLEKWSNVDIGIVRVESPYDFNAVAPLPGCSWVPGVIEVNYMKKYQDPGTDAIVFGWGHKDKWRKVDDVRDHNQNLLQYAPVLVQDKEECKKAYAFFEKTLPVIDKYMICTFGDGNINAEGEVVRKGDPLIATCSNETSVPDEKTPDKIKVDDKDKTRSDDNNQEISNNSYYGVYENISFRRNISAFNNTRKALPVIRRSNGICQNDHGGPLVTWLGANLVLIGVASVFLVDPQDYSCTGPYLYTSTFCNGKFLGCVLHQFDNETTAREGKMAQYCPDGICMLRSDPESVKRREIFSRYDDWYRQNKKFCNLPPEQRGFNLVQRRISWASHPDGPAYSELQEDIFERPQVPLNMYV